MEHLKRLGVGAIEGAAILLAVRWHGIWLGLMAAAVVWWLARQRHNAPDAVVFGLGLASLAIVLAINLNWVGQIIILAGYLWWRYGLLEHKRTLKFAIFEAAWLEFMALAAVFSAQAIWHWPLIVVLVSVYLASVVVARSFFGPEERATNALAAAWGLIVAECSYVFSIWLVSYVLFGDVLLIPQAAVVITALGYCFGSIYLAHSSSKLSKARLAEYAIIGLCLIVIVIAGSKWSGGI